MNRTTVMKHTVLGCWRLSMLDKMLNLLLTHIYVPWQCLLAQPTSEVLSGRNKWLRQSAERCIIYTDTLRLGICYCKSVCRLKRSCTTQSVEIFGNISIRHFVHQPSADFHAKFYGDRPRGTPPSGVECKRRSQIYIAVLNMSKAVSRKRYKIRPRVQLMTNRKSQP